jgi:hypothetical protein
MNSYWISGRPDVTAERERFDAQGQKRYKASEQRVLGSFLDWGRALTYQIVDQLLFPVYQVL